MWNLISHFLIFAGGMASGVMLMCLMQTGKLADLQQYSIQSLERDYKHYYFIIRGK